MFDVGGISAGNTGTNSAGLSGAMDNSILDRDDFMMLLLAELQHQDPLNPMDNQEYVAQLTQFSSLDELQSMRELLETQQQNAATNLNAQSIGMIGREVTAADYTVDHIPGGEAKFTFQLGASQEAMVRIYDSNGRVVQSGLVEGSGQGGWSTFTFDGRSSSGAMLPAGQYHVRVTSGVNESGEGYDHEVFQMGRVTGVDFTGEAAILELEGGQRVPLSSIVGVREVS